ncbi:MAG TPA: GPW/gp25 family protein [Candidatus Sulfotelmatobacter sp.]|nr:GPW/gp25 family protein [Candidatus Sulfotelmatobacter sp.]
MDRHDYAFPFRIDAASGQAAQTPYPTHVDQMIRQVLLTSPGERIDLPEFGCGLRQLIFAPHSSALDATTNIIVLQALNRWLAGIITVQQVTVVPLTSGDDPAQLQIQIQYTLLATQTNGQVQVSVS